MRRFRAQFRKRFGAMYVTSIAVSALAGASWPAAIWAPLDPRAMAVTLGAAVAVTPVAALLWVARWGLRDRALSYLLDKAVSQRVRPLARTEPLRVVR